MPGTIQVLVLEITAGSTGDASFSAVKEAKSSPLFLNVAMGKRDYRTCGGEELSFPVTSMRENLRVMMCNGEGNLISQTEINVMSVVEKGLWDDIFPLEGGGTVRLRLQLVLSEEERMKIQEMRLSALKRKHQELLKGGEIDGYDKDGRVETASKLQDSAEGLKLLIAEEALNTSQSNEEKNKIDSASESAQERGSHLKKNMDNQMLYSESPTTARSTKESTSLSKPSEDQLNNTKKKKIAETSSASSVRKMVSAFEQSKPQQLGHNAGLGLSDEGKNATKGSLRRTSSGDSELKRMFRATLAKSFSTETLNNINAEDNSKTFKPFHHKKQEGIQQFNQIATAAASIQRKDNSQVSEKLRSSNKAGETENASLLSVETSKSSLSTDTNMLKKSYVAGKVKTLDNLKSSSSAPEAKLRGSRENPTMGMKSKVYQPKVGNVTTIKDAKVSVQEKQMVTSNVKKVVNKNAEHDPQTVHMAHIEKPRKQISDRGKTLKDMSCICYRCHLTKEQLPYGNSHGSVEVLSIPREQDLFGPFEMLVPRYVCLTTGSKQLRTLLSSCRICLGSLSEVEVSGDYDTKKKRMLQDSSGLIIDNLKHESPSGMSNILGRLIDQGARLIVIIVACGTLLLSVK